MHRLVVKLTVGDSEPERCSQAFSVAAAAIAAGADASVWLTGDAVGFAKPGFAEGFTLADSTSMTQLRDLVMADGLLTVCTQCAQRRSLTAADFLPAVRIAGSAAFVEECLIDGTQALVY
ncbi:MAG: DsrE family protein [Candidatus Nanopelagicales bacterium]|nr:DsrE family protein [Candidatus Nanopelagicales bacterium]